MHRRQMCHSEGLSHGVIRSNENRILNSILAYCLQIHYHLDHKPFPYPNLFCFIYRLVNTDDKCTPLSEVKSTLVNYLRTDRLLNSAEAVAKCLGLV